MTTLANESPAAGPLDALWQPRTMIWVLLTGEGLALVLALAPAQQAGRLVYFGLASLVVQWVALLTLALLYLARRALRRVAPQRTAWIALVLLLVNTLLVSSWAEVLLGRNWLADGEQGWAGLTVRLLGIALTVGLLGLAAFQNVWRARIAALRQKHAELEALQARVRPHFLFNTLNTAAALARGHPEQTEKVLLDLADLFRAALAGPREISLADELTLVRRYLEIESLRFGERLRVEWSLPETLPRLEVPALSVQPLVENAIHHAVERLERGCMIQIAVSVTTSAVIVRIRNPLVLGDVRRPPNHGVGLQAARARIAAMTAGRGSVVAKAEGEHYVATVTVPRPRPAIRG